MKNPQPAPSPELLQTTLERENRKLYASIQDQEGKLASARKELETRLASRSEDTSEARVLEERIRQTIDHLSSLQKGQEALNLLKKALEASPSSGDTHKYVTIEEDRRRISREIHDGPAQSLANLILQIDLLNRLYKVNPEMFEDELRGFKRTLEASLQDLRRLIFDLRPMSLDDLGLLPALKKYIEEYQKKSNISVYLRTHSTEVRLTPEMEQSIYRIVVEVLSNIKKHSGATKAEITFTFSVKKLEVTIVDNGQGFNQKTVGGTEGGHLGLTSLKERTDQHGGTLNIKSTLGEGTRIEFSAPLP